VLRFGGKQEGVEGNNVGRRMIERTEKNGHHQCNI
jgi:hypothetical protein